MRDLSSDRPPGGTACYFVGPRAFVTGFAEDSRNPSQIAHLRHPSRPALCHDPSEIVRDDRFDPAAQLPAYAADAGATLIIINLSETPMDGQASLIIRAKAGEAMSRIMQKLTEKMSG